MTFNQVLEARKHGENLFHYFMQGHELIEEESQITSPWEAENQFIKAFQYIEKFGYFEWQCTNVHLPHTDVEPELRAFKLETSGRQQSISNAALQSQKELILTTQSPIEVEESSIDE